MGNASREEDNIQQNSSRRRWRAACVVGLATWIGARTVVASSVNWLPVPFIGYVRDDIAAGLLAAGAVFTWVLSTLPILLQAVLVSLFLGAPLVADPPRLYLTEEPSTAHFTSSSSADLVAAGAQGVRVLAGLSRSDSARIAAVAWEERQLWCHFSGASSFVGYFGFGGSLNFDAGEDSSNLPFWSLKYGFRSRLAHESAFARTCRDGACTASTARAALLSTIAELPWYSESLRLVIAAGLGAPPSKVVLGGEGPLQNREITHPTVQVMLPSVFWHVAVNPHVDTIYFYDEIGGAPCERQSLSTFLLPLTHAAGAGLLWWSWDRSANQVVEHTSLYEVGKMYTFNASLAHAIRPFPYLELWTTPRMTIQAFGAKCGDTWYVYH